MTSPTHKKSKTQTVLLIRNAAKQDFGGAETYPVSLASILKDEGYCPIIVTRSNKLLHHARNHSIDTIHGWWWSHQNWSGWRVVLSPLYILWQIILTIWYIQLFIRTHASVIHIQSRDDFIAATFAGRICRLKVIWTDHMDLRYIFQNISKPFRNPVGKFVFWAAHFANHIILISNNEYSLVTAHFKHKNALSKQIVLVKNGVIDQGTAEQQNKDTCVDFCLACRIVSNKGIGEAIQAFIGLRSQFKNTKTKIRLLIYGDGPDMARFKKLAQGIDNIIFFGHQEKAVEKVRSADVFVLPSYQEGLSVALLEATMLGKAIIASDVDSNPEIIVHHKTGLLVKVRDIQSLQNAMHELVINEKLRHQLEKNARKNYEENFNLVDITKKQILPLYIH